METETYNCQDCGNEFTEYEEFGKHMKEDHGEEATETTINPKTGFPEDTELDTARFRMKTEKDILDNDQVYDEDGVHANTKHDTGGFEWQQGEEKEEKLSSVIDKINKKNAPEEGWDEYEKNKADEFNIGTTMICPVCNKEIDVGNTGDDGLGLDYNNVNVAWDGAGTYPVGSKMQDHFEQEHKPSDFGIGEAWEDWKTGNQLYDAFDKSFPEFDQHDAHLTNMDTSRGDGVNTYNDQGHGRFDNLSHTKCPNCGADELFDKSGHGNWGKSVYCQNCNWEGDVNDTSYGESIANEDGMDINLGDLESSLGLFIIEELIDGQWKKVMYGDMDSGSMIGRGTAETERKGHEDGTGIPTRIVQINESIATEDIDGLYSNLDANTTDVDQCIVCGRGTSDHSNPNTDYRGMRGDSPPTDHYFQGGNSGGSDDHLYFTDKKGGFAGYHGDPDEKVSYFNGDPYGVKESIATESSVNCTKCQTRVWDKDQGLMNGSYEEDGKTICGNCGDDVFKRIRGESRATEDMDESVQGEVFDYLFNLQESGETNMFGAGSYVQSEFGMSGSEAREYVTYWMDNYDNLKRSRGAGESKALEASFKNQDDGGLTVGGKNVIKIWESFQGWYWYAIEDQGQYETNDGATAHAWYGFVQGFEEEWGTWDSIELENNGVWTVPRSSWSYTGRRDNYENIILIKDKKQRINESKLRSTENIWDEARTNWSGGDITGDISKHYFGNEDEILNHGGKSFDELPQNMKDLVKSYSEDMISNTMSMTLPDGEEMDILQSRINEGSKNSNPFDLTSELEDVDDEDIPITPPPKSKAGENELDLCPICQDGMKCSNLMSHGAEWNTTNNWSTNGITEPTQDEIDANDANENDDRDHVLNKTGDHTWIDGSGPDGVADQYCKICGTIKTDESKPKALEGVTIEYDRIEPYPTKANEVEEKDEIPVEVYDDIYDKDEMTDSDDEEATELIRDRKMNGYGATSIASELMIMYGVTQEEAFEKVGAVEVSTNDRVSWTFFGKKYSECNEAQKNELALYGGSE